MVDSEPSDNYFIWSEYVWRGGGREKQTTSFTLPWNSRIVYVNEHWQCTIVVLVKWHLMSEIKPHSIE